METKAEIRRRIIQLRNGLSEENRRKSSFLVTERILGHQWFYLADTILGFVSYGTEIDTSDLLKEALRQGKKVYVPRVEGDVMNFYRISSMEELTIGYKGIPEPDGTSECFSYKQELADKQLLLMPGVAFDMQRNRIGYGKGFYDKFLSDKPQLQLRSIAIGYGCQMVEQIPAEECDIKPYQVICI